MTSDELRLGVATGRALCVKYRSKLARKNATKRTTKMKYSWALNLYDEDGDAYKQGVLVFGDGKPIMMFETSYRMEAFAKAMLNSLPQLRELRATTEMDSK